MNEQVITNHKLRFAAPFFSCNRQTNRKYEHGTLATEQNFAGKSSLLFTGVSDAC